MPTKTIDATDPIVQRLNVLAKSSPELTTIIQVYATILPMIRDTDLHPSMIALTPDEACAKLQNNVPLLCDERLAFDDDSAAKFMTRLAHALEIAPTPGEAPPQHRRLWHRSSKAQDAHPLVSHDSTALRMAAAQQIRLALEQNRIDVTALLAHIAATDRAWVVLLAQKMQLDANLLWTLAQNAVRPAYRAWAQQVGPLPRAANWERADCFVCGDLAMLAELQGNDQEKHLRCGRCGADWRFPRLKCAHCRNEDPQTLNQLFPETQRDRMRIEVCDRCHHYLKVISAFSPSPVELLAVEDLATLHLDYIAQAHGYSRVVPE